VGLGLGAGVGPGEGPCFGGQGLGPLGEGLDGVKAWVLEIGQVLVLEWDHQERGQVWVLERGQEWGQGLDQLWGQAWVLERYQERGQVLAQEWNHHQV
jgi:hypothetical protein